MDEALIAASLQRSIPQPTTEPAPIAAPQLSSDEDSAVTAPEFDEMTMFKINQYFGNVYEPLDKETNDRLRFIWQAAQNLAKSTDWWAVTAKIADLQTMLGLNHDPDKIRKLWLWTRLNQERVGIERQMRALGG